MIFTDLTIANFFSITEEIHLPLDNQGLVLIVGENHDSSAADSNGSGKSALLESITWCLWGKTARGESGDSIINKTSKKDCHVYLTMRDGDQYYTVRRYRNHHQHKNSLQLWSGSTDLSEGTSTLTQAKLDDLLGIDFDSFIRGPMMPQGGFKRFSQMTDSEQKAIMENALQLNLLPAALEKVKNRINEATLEHQTKTLQLEQTKERWKRENEEFEQLNIEKRNMRYQVVLQKAEWLSKIMWAVQEYEWAWDHWQCAIDTTPQQEALNKITGLEQQLIKKWDENLKEAVQEEFEQNVTCRTIQNDIAKLKITIEQLRKLEPDSICPTCHQRVKQPEIGKCLVDYGTKLMLLKSEYTDTINVYNKATEHTKQIQKDKQESLDRAVKIREQAESDLSVIQQNHKYNEDMLSMMNKALDVISSRPSKFKESAPLDNLIEAKAKAQVELSCLINELMDSIKEKEILLNHLNFWKTGFSNSGLKSRILESITPFMNHQADVYIRDLTDGELQIEFNTQTQLKSGQVREQFNVEVRNKNGAKTYDGSSGGEKARADLAITLTLSDLVASRSRKSYPQRWFDEPFESMDQAGIEAVMELLAKMVEICGTIFVITHQDFMKALFNKVITIEKRNGATKLAA